MKKLFKGYRVANSFLKSQLKYISVFWSKLAVIQRIIFIGIILAVIVSFVALHTLPQIPLSPVIDAPIRDEAALDRIVLRINQEGVKTFVTPEGLVQVANETTARRMRAILIREDLIPMNIDPWAIFDRERWTITDFERNINFRRAQTRMITDHIKAIDDVDDADVVFVIPTDQNPVTASVIITPQSGSDITTNRKK